MATQNERDGSSSPEDRDPLVVGESVLIRAKLIARQIARRVKELTEDTGLEKKALDGTAEEPPVG
jgi:hypothetical protein